MLDLFTIATEICGTARRKNIYEVKRADRGESITLDGEATVFIGYITNDVIVETEYVLMDASALLSALGGSVGVYLGWSMLDLAKFINALITRFCAKKRK
jgi:hypothetical protein